MKRIALIGAGWVTQHHLRAYAALKDRVRVVAIADPLPAAREARAKEFGIPKTYPDVAALLAHEQVDAVDVAVPREHHAPVCRLVAEKGLPILCQKPLAPTLAEAERLVREVTPRVRLMVHENWRFRPHYRQIRQLLDAGRIGKVRQALMTLLTSGFIKDESGQLPAVARQPFFADEQRLLLMEVLIHHVDCLRFLFGPLALDGARLGKSCREIKGEDRAMMMMTASSGAAVMLVGDFMAHGYPPAQFDRLEILGEEGTIRLEGRTLDILGKRPERHEVDLEGNYTKTYIAVIAHFLDRLDDGKPFETGPEDNLETLKLCERAYEIGFGKDAP